jgi:hypothetical protein
VEGLRVLLCIDKVANEFENGGVNVYALASQPLLALQLILIDLGASKASR